MLYFSESYSCLSHLSDIIGPTLINPQLETCSTPGVTVCIGTVVMGFDSNKQFISAGLDHSLTPYDDELNVPSDWGIYDYNRITYLLVEMVSSYPNVHSIELIILSGIGNNDSDNLDAASEAVHYFSETYPMVTICLTNRLNIFQTPTDEETPDELIHIMDIMNFCLDITINSKGVFIHKKCPIPVYNLDDMTHFCLHHPELNETEKQQMIMDINTVRHMSS